MPEVDPLGVRCPHCDAVPGQRCMAVSDWARKPHNARAKLALSVAAHNDPMLDGFPGLGPDTRCGLCGTPGLPQRHRVIDAIAGRLAAGEDQDAVAMDYGLSDTVIMAVLAWSAKWPGAWS